LAFLVEDAHEQLRQVLSANRERLEAPRAEVLVDARQDPDSW
jgi:hypothetical protein